MQKLVGSPVSQGACSGGRASLVKNLRGATDSHNPPYADGQARGIGLVILPKEKPALYF